MYFCGENETILVKLYKTVYIYFYP